MNSLARFALFSIALQLSLHAHAFENLDFEQAMPVITGNTYNDCCGQPVESILPHWTVTDLLDRPVFSGMPLTEIYFNSGHIGLSPTIFNVYGGSGEGNGFFSPGTPIQGDYSLQIRGLAGGELFQAGTVPLGTRSVRFLGFFEAYALEQFTLEGERPAEEIDLYFGSEKLDVVEVERFDSQNEYGANIPAHLVDTEGELRFVVPTARALILDDIRFTPIPVPEPSTVFLIGFCCLFLPNSRQCGTVRR